MALHNISESVYVGLCRTYMIGKPQQVAIRRNLSDITELLKQKVALSKICLPVKMDSGSSRDGFRFRDSDVDIMYWPHDYKVLWDFSQATLYNTQRYKLILCDSSESPPGFTLLWLPLETAGRYVLTSCVRINGSLYISSTMYRGQMQTRRPGTTVHGPCCSGREGGENGGEGLEYDYADCFVSDFWPPSASSWIDRCHSWPPPHVVDDIIRSGCHFVAIGHKLGKHADNEWRVSFSQAEQKLVYVMNHTQFLTYGLLKLFVKEFNGKSEGEKLLCSYHMKTAIFWSVQQNTIAHWCPKNLLACFWVCFKRLLKWVYEGVCPNFFIPENNMFLGKVYGEAQRNLFTRLYDLYEKGIAFLLQSPYIRPFFMKVLCNPRQSVCTNECTLISEVELDMNLFIEIAKNDACYVLYKLNRYMEHLHIVEQLIRLPLTQCQIPMLQKLTAVVLQNYALHITEMAKVKLARPGLMNWCQVDPDRYTEAVGGQSWSYKMRHAVSFGIEIVNSMCLIDELIPELLNVRILTIPPFILLHMLEFLCCRHVDPVRAQVALDDLQVLVQHDQGVLVPVFLRDISWEILGICQQMTGNHQAALYSYRQSLRQIQFHKIHIATRQRIQDLH
ncbi:uncharacterized protein LOC111107008 isoform X2 [Crassostrea virginica]